jgi:hypothetical protein
VSAYGVLTEPRPIQRVRPRLAAATKEKAGVEVELV